MLAHFTKDKNKWESILHNTKLIALKTYIVGKTYFNKLKFILDGFVSLKNFIISILQSNSKNKRIKRSISGIFQ